MPDPGLASDRARHLQLTSETLAWRELTTVRAEQESRASASEPGRSPDVSGLTSGELERTRRELSASLALARRGSLTRGPILAHLAAIDAELAGRAADPAHP